MVVIEMVVDNRNKNLVGKVVTKGRRQAKRSEPGICIRFSCRDNSSFRLNSLGPLASGNVSNFKIAICHL